MLYTISEMAKLLGVTTHMLRYYEKIGILKPYIDDENGYRYYSVLDTRRFNFCRQLFSSGIPLKDCAEIMNDMPIKDIDSLIDLRIRAKEKEIYLQNAALENLKRLKLNMDRSAEMPDKAWVENFPEMWRLNCSKLENAVSDSAVNAEKDEWLSCLPAVTWSSKIPRKALLEGCKKPVYYEYGLMCEKRRANILGIKKTRHVEAIPAGEYLVAMQRKEEKEPFSWKHCETLLREMKKLKVKTFGDMLCETAASRIENGETVNYHFLRVKIYA